MTSIGIKRILCPTDFSPFSVLALRHALVLARRFEARLKFLHVIPRPFPGSESIYGGAPWIMTADVRPAALDQMRRFLEPVREARVDHEIEVREGDPWREILAVAEELTADLVVLGTHGRGGLDRFMLGSVTEKLTRRLPCPVLTVCHEEGRTWATPGLVTKILCAIDFSEHSAEVFKMALALAAEHRAELTLLHAVETILDYEGQAYVSVPDARRIREDLAASAHGLLQKTIDDAGERTVRVAPRVVHGRAYEEILRVATEERSDLVVIGAQGHGFLEHLLAGSNAQHVIRRATCPVLSVRPLRLARREASEPHGLARPDQLKGGQP